MEALYSKLYDKYKKLKTRKESEIEQLNHDQEEKFMNYVSVAEDLIEHLISENSRLHEQVKVLTNEMALIRSANARQCDEYQKMLMEENEKNKELLEEVERIRNLQRDEVYCSTKNDNHKGKHFSTAGDIKVGSRDLSSRSAKSRKRTRHSGAQTDESGVIQRANGQMEHAVEREPESDQYRATSSDNDRDNIQLPDCCRRKSSGITNDAGPINCLFQVLVECLVGMKLAAVEQPEGLCLSAFHQSSGYSFSLTWVSKATEEESELLYRALSLGTFERVAPEWMREVLMFSINMCPVFFERISRVIKLHK